LARAGVLRAACSVFQLAVEASEVARCRNELRAQEERVADVQWLGEIIDRLRERIASNGYRLMATPKEPLGSSGKRSRGRRGSNIQEDSLAMEAFMALVGGDLGQGDVVLVDDRYTNRFLRFQAAPVVGIVDVLTALEEAGFLDEAAVNRCMATLRDANVRLLPLRPKEVLQYLRAAPVEQRAVVETPALRSIRRYTAACALSANTLQMPLTGLRRWPPT
jgi:hypothetical protein